MPQPKLFRMTGGRAVIALERDNVRLQVENSDGTPQAGISVTRKGTVICGPMATASMAHEQKNAVIFTPLPHFAMMIPPTIVTPLPKHIPIPPIGGIAGIVALNAFMLSLLG